MTTKCDVCGEPFEESKLAAHMLDAHPDVAAPDTNPGTPVSAGHRCVQCGAELPSAEALKEHNAARHGM
jgi:hypothetical protein